jgi:hypothetical protein
MNPRASQEILTVVPFRLKIAVVRHSRDMATAGRGFKGPRSGQSAHPHVGSRDRPHARPTRFTSDRYDAGAFQDRRDSRVLGLINFTADDKPGAGGKTRSGFAQFGGPGDPAGIDIRGTEARALRDAAATPRR